MTTFSNRPHCRVGKYWPLIASDLSLLFFLFLWVSEDQTEYSLLILSLLLYPVYYGVTRKLTEVEMNSQRVVIVSSKTAISWNDITCIEYHPLLNVYRMEAAGRTYWIPPYSIPVIILGYKVPDEMDDLINRKKRELDL